MILIKKIDDTNKKIDGLLNNIKNKKSKDLVNKKIDYTVNNIGNRK